MTALANHPLAYNLDYVHCVDGGRINERGYLEGERYEWRERLVVMRRHSPDKMLGETEDSFTVVDAQTGEILGDGDSKADANSSARYRLMDASRKVVESKLQTA